MPVDLFTFVGMYERALTTAEHVLDRGAESAASQGTSERDMLEWRLIDDMFPLGFQFMTVINFAGQWPARVAGLPVPESVDADLDVAGFKSAIAKARQFLSGLTADQFRGRDDVPLKYRMGAEMEPTMPSGQWLTGFATTNLFFHLSTAYGILRARGVQIGKRDLFAGGL